MRKVIEFYNRYEEPESLKYRRELLNMKLTISILNKDDKKQIKEIKNEIRRLTKIIGDKYLDAYDILQLEIKQTISNILCKEVTEENAYTHAVEIEELIINQNYKIKENEFKNELTILYETYEQLGYTPQNIKKDLSRVKYDTLEINKIDYINQLLYNLKEEYLDKEKISVLQTLREEITIKTREKAIKKIKRNHFKLV